ncbi:SDR family oxidoreductase [Microvirga arabica]|nr:SDR family oxidoreductase [Microvirga arabica]
MTIPRPASRPDFKFATHPYAPDNIRMDNVLPGWIDGLPATEKHRDSDPIKRYVTNEEDATTIAFAASKEGRYITGQNNRVDGGSMRTWRHLVITGGRALHPDSFGSVATRGSRPSATISKKAFRSGLKAEASSGLSCGPASVAVRACARPPRLSANRPRVSIKLWD